MAMAFVCVILAGCNPVSSTNHLQEEYSSQTNEKFYQKMVDMEKNSTLTFDGFPACLTPLLGHINLGDEIFTTNEDTLSFAFRGLDYEDINRYPYYVIKDNYENIWTLFRYNDKYVLTRENEKEYNSLLTEIEQPVQ